MIKNKKGIGPLLIIGIMVFLIFALVSGIFTTLKINNLISSIPPIFWYVLIGILFIWLISKK